MSIFNLIDFKRKQLFEFTSINGWVIKIFFQLLLPKLFVSFCLIVDRLFLTFQHLEVSREHKGQTTFYCLELQKINILFKWGDTVP